MTWYLHSSNSWEKAVLPYQRLLNTYVSMYIDTLEPGELPKDGYVSAPTYDGKIMMAHITPLDHGIYQMKDMIGNVMEFMLDPRLT